MDRMSQHEGASTAAGASGTAHVSDAAGRRREDRIVGASEATRQVIARATAAASNDHLVLLVGPAGSDRELVARAIHTWGPRSSADLEALSCASVPEALQSREVFGCAEGVYPAVPGAHVGAFERNASSTLLLDAFDELRSDVATAILRAARDRRFQREGESTPRTLGARLICTSASEAPPALAEMPHHLIQLSPLAERPEDVLPLAAHYLAAFSEELGRQPVGLTADARACLQAETWPGDVRELRERIRQAVRLCGEGAITAESLMLARDAEEVPSFKEAKRAFETRYVTGLLRRCDGNISRAARLAKKDRKDFYDVIRRTGVDPGQFRS